MNLDKIEVFVDKPWVFIDGSNNHHDYTFMRDGRLLMSLNGTVTIGKWELLPTQRLLIDRLFDKVMLNNVFINNDILVLQKNGTSDEPFVLVNQKVIKDLNYVDYLKELDTKQQNKQALKNPNPRVTKNNFVAGDYINVGDILDNENGVMATGTYKHIVNNAKFFKILNNKVISIYYVEFGKFMINGRWEKIKLHVSTPGSISINDQIINDQNLLIPIYEKFRIYSSNDEAYTIKVNEKLVVFKTFAEIMYLVLLGVGIIVTFLILLVVSNF